MLSVVLLIGLQYSRLSSVNPSEGGTGQLALSTPLTLNTVAYADSKIHSSLSLPSYSQYLGSSYRIIGALISRGSNGTAQVVQVIGYNGTVVSYERWQASIFIWNGLFQNGTTTAQQILNSGGVEVMETPSPPGVNSTRSALEILAPTTECATRTLTGGGTQTKCQTLSQSGGDYMTKIGGLAVVVSPQSHTVTWLNDVSLRWFEVTSNSVGTSQLLGVAGSLIT
jgi:hypothetical protein